jgi:hypothetical protein
LFIEEDLWNAQLVEKNSQNVEYFAAYALAKPAVVIAGHSSKSGQLLVLNVGLVYVKLQSTPMNLGARF